MTHYQKEKLTSLIITIVLLTMTLTTLFLMALLAIMSPAAFS